VAPALASAPWSQRQIVLAQHHRFDRAAGHPAQYGGIDFATIRLVHSDSVAAIGLGIKTVLKHLLRQVRADRQAFRRRHPEPHGTRVLMERRWRQHAAGIRVGHLAVLRGSLGAGEQFRTGGWSKSPLLQHWFGPIWRGRRVGASGWRLHHWRHLLRLLGFLVAAVPFAHLDLLNGLAGTRSRRLNCIVSAAGHRVCALTHTPAWISTIRTSAAASLRQVTVT
jgi:hypothetical protein